jgi:hypothetical protein
VIPALGDAPPRLEFTIIDVQALPESEPALCFHIGIEAGGRAITGSRLKVRIRIHAERRRYSAAETERLWDLFGPADQWRRSLGPVPWTKLEHELGPFDGQTTMSLRVPATFEFGAAAPKYLAALETGVVPLELLFSGTVSWPAAEGRDRTAMIPWDRDASCRMPLSIWRELEPHE